jgi:two-component system sensor histidine kinase KdpD
MDGPEDSPDATTSHIWDRLPHPLAGLPAAGAGVALSGLISIACLAASWLPAHGVAMLYLLAVVGGAVAFGIQCGLWAAGSAFLAYNFFFLAPIHTLTIADPRDVVALSVFIAVAVAAGSLAGRLRELAERARVRSIALQRLNALAAHLSGASTLADVANALADEAAKATSGHAVVMMSGSDGLAMEANIPAHQSFSSADWQAAQRSLSSRQSIYPASPGWPGSTYAFHPVIVRDTALAVLGVKAEGASDSACDATLRAMVHHAAIAMERLSIEAEKATAEKQAETERLRAALLSSVSHDIKTPLASIQGAVTSLRELGERMPEETKSDLLLTIEEEAGRLLRFVTNLLDMTRLQSGVPDILQDWIDLEDVMSSSVSRARRLMPEADIRGESSAARAIVRGNETLVEHVLLNLIENAVAFSPAGTTVRVKISEAGSAYRVLVEDEGRGIARDDLERVFEKFFRGAEASAGGSGLGLTIASEVMLALGGTISAESPIAAGKGTRITLEFPKRAVAEMERRGGE